MATPSAHSSGVRRLIATLVLLALVASSAVPVRLPAWLDSLWQSSTLSKAAAKAGEVRAVQSAEAPNVAPPPFRAGLDSLRPPTWHWPFAVRALALAVRELEPRAWLRDQRESIRRVCRRSAPRSSSDATGVG